MKLAQPRSLNETRLADPIASDRPDTTDGMSDAQIAAALAVEASAPGAAKLLSYWNERSVTADDVIRHVTASPRPQLVEAFCAKAQGRSAMTGATSPEGRIRALAALQRGRERRSRK